MSSQTTASGTADGIGRKTAQRRTGKVKNTLRHDLGNELAVVSGCTWLALTSLRHLSEKLEGDAQIELQSIISMVERVKSSAEQGRKLLTVPATALAMPKAKIAPSSEKHRILAIDDSSPLLALLSKILTRTGYEVETFTDPLAALQRFGETPDAFTAIVTDELMPDMPGAALAKKVRAIRPAIPIVLCSGAPESRYSGRKDWAQATIRKPYRPHDLSLIVHGVIAEAQKAPCHTFVASAAEPVSCDNRANAQ
jgi:CheY-like chemotaxis protein